MMKIHETVGAAGELAPIFLAAAGGAATLVDDRGAHPLPDGAIAAVMARYGAPLDPDVTLAPIATLELVEGRLRHVRHLARYDVIAKDWLVYERAGEDPVIALATTVAGALGHLARAADPLAGS